MKNEKEKKQEKVLAFGMALRLAEVNLSLAMIEFMYNLKELADEKSEDLSIKDIKKLMDEINAKYPQTEN